MAVRRRSKFRGRGLSLRSRLYARSVCSCRLWRYISVMPLPFYVYNEDTDIVKLTNRKIEYITSQIYANYVKPQI